MAEFMRQVIFGIRNNVSEETPEDGGNRFLRNFGYYLQYFTAYKPIRSTFRYKQLKIRATAKLLFFNTGIS